MDKTPIPNCGNCRWGSTFVAPDRTINPQQRQCKRMPPNAVAIHGHQGVQIMSIWPIVTINDHCHEWRQRMELPVFSANGVADVQSKN
jgi:hypothetical protein